MYLLKCYLTGLKRAIKEDCSMWILLFMSIVIPALVVGIFFLVAPVNEFYIIDILTNPYTLVITSLVLVCAASKPLQFFFSRIENNSNLASKATSIANYYCGALFIWMLIDMYTAGEANDNAYYIALLGAIWWTFSIINYILAFNKELNLHRASLK